MITILIADDEELIRQGIIAILKSSIKSDVTYLEAENGLEALKICKEQYPQIIVSDIRMPFCNGLQFIEKVKAIGYSPTIIVISGYSEFEYAKQAIKYGVKDYVLKPIQKRQFIHLIQTCMDEITDKKTAMHNEHVNNQTNAKAAKAVRKKLLTDLLDCKDEEKIEKINNIEYCNSFFNGNFALCCVIQYKIDKNNLDYIDLAIINIVEEILKQENLFENAVIETYSEGRIALVFDKCDTEAKLNSIVGAISKAFQSIKIFLKIEVFAGIGDIQYGPTRLYKSFHHACQASNNKLYQLGNSIQRYGKENTEQYDFIHFETVLRGLDHLEPLEIIQLFNPLIHKKPSIQAAYAIEKSYRSLIKTIQDQLDNVQDLPQPTPFDNFWNFMQLKHDIEIYLHEIKALINESKSESSNNKLIQNIIQYVKDNVSNDINLNSVADRFSYSPPYISSLFKKQIGIGFNEFLTKTRMDMAKDMLKSTEVPINEISELCGYGNSKYFAASFKKSFGVSPSSFRQN